MQAAGYIYYIAAAAGAAVSAYSSVKAGQAQRAALEAEARARDGERRVADLQSLQISANAREEMNANLAAISAVRAARNASPYSPSAAAIDKGFRSESQRALEANLLDPMLRARNASYAAQAARAKGSAAATSGYAGAFGSLVDVAGYAGKLAPKKKDPTNGVYL